ncbi:MAG: metallophosphoesterase, partial [Bdellovibrionaceae bacterium]|nr:metallophosphoesterase [Pseudobdellovibrionaceae bacterium]
MSFLYTAIISDLHLTDPEPPRHKTKSRHPLWKKFKTKDFYIDESLVQFLDHIQAQAGGHRVELILNGDIFDFDSVMSLPSHPIYKINWLETRRGLFPKQEKSLFKIKTILDEHQKFVASLRQFILNGHKVVIIPGNHDVELHFPNVQKEVRDILNLPEDRQEGLVFTGWFYISNQDTLIEHGHQQDPYCVCENPLNPFLLDYNELSVRLPFGNVACRYMMNGLGLFNPHVEKNYIMSVSGYIKFFFKYLITTQPLIMWTWLWGSIATLWHVTVDRFSTPYKGIISNEELVNNAAEKSQATPTMVRRLEELFVVPAVNNPLLIAKELWLDRLFLIIFMFAVFYFVVSTLKTYLDISLFWIFVPFLLFLPFFLFYARSVNSLVSEYKEPDETLLSRQAEITQVKRVVYGHTHIPRHEFYGFVEHLNSGTWSPAFTNVECTESSERN